MIASIELGKKLTPEYLGHLNEIVNNDLNPIEYLSIDPGKANGVCGYDAKYYLQFMFTIAANDMVMFLHQFDKVKKCVTEGYKVYPNKLKDHIYSDLETPRVIGRIESWATVNNVDLIIQPATIKYTGYKWLGEKPRPKSDKKNHQLDAHVHFIYWGVTSGRIQLEDLIRRNVQKRT
jgi:hypothetical protein